MTIDTASFMDVPVMLCPACQSELDLVEAPGATSMRAAQCGSCQGVWLDRDQAEVLLPGLPAVPPLRMDGLPEGARSDRRCPRCDEDLRALVRGGVVFESSLCCFGVWLDRGELERLADALRKHPPDELGSADWVVEPLKQFAEQQAMELLISLLLRRL
jgi:Zn-finger nucleic acid-binding protein